MVVHRCNVGVVELQDVLVFEAISVGSTVAFFVLAHGLHETFMAASPGVAMQGALEMVFYGSISEDDDVQDMLVSEAGAVGRWNPDI
eukprot:scaffold98131_cov19-Tisochrysis_lutea.AAC.1